MEKISNIGQGFLINWGPGINLQIVVENRVITALNFFIAFSALVAVILIVVAGYMFITSAGDPEKVEKAQKAITAAIVGMIIVFLARVIVGFVIDIGEGNFPTGGSENSTPSDPINRVPRGNEPIMR